MKKSTDYFATAPIVEPGAERWLISYLEQHINRLCVMIRNLHRHIAALERQVGEDLNE